MQWKKISLVFFFALLLVGCGKEQGLDSKKNVENMVVIHQHLVQASDDSHQAVLDVVRDFDEEDMSYDTLKNVLKNHQDVHVSLKESMQAQGTTPYRKEVSHYFETLLDERVKSYDSLLGLVRQKDAVALGILAESLEEKEKQIKASLLLDVNALLQEKDVKAIDALEK